MPKRSFDKKIDKYKNKIRKLERKRLRVIRSDSSSSDQEVENHTAQNGSRLGLSEIVSDLPQLENSSQGLTVDTVEAPITGDTELPVIIQNNDVTIPDESSVNTLDPELISALGESTDDTPDYGEKILDNLANLWLPLLRKGLPNETKDKVLKEYSVPDNCRLLQAPKLNVEISAAVPDMVRNRDKNLAITQQQLGAGITAINRAMDLLIKGQDKAQTVKHLSNACRILSDLHTVHTQTRIKLLSPRLDKTFLHVIQDSERDETIFGNKLSEKIKAARAIERQGLQIKKVTTPKPSTSTSTQQAGSRPTYSGNWTAPPRYPSSRGGRGARRTTANNRRPYAVPQTNKASGQNRPRAPIH